MVKYILISVFIYIFSDCSNNVQKENVITKNPRCEISNNFTRPFGNPVLICGSSFGAFFQSMYRNNQFEKMLNFTSRVTKKKFGEQKLKAYYETTFKFDSDLGALSNVTINQDTFLLTYSKARQFATRTKITIPVVNENDSTKLLLNVLSKTPFQ